MEHRAKILVVDDEEELRTVIVFGLDSYLGELSFEEAKDGQEAMEKFRAGNTYDLVISDYRMPNATGHDLFKFLEQNHPDQPFILCSSEVDCFNEFEGKKNVVGIVEKPDIIDPLVNLVKQQLQSDGKTTDYCRISLTSLLQGHNLKSDVFIRLSDEKYVRVAPEGQTFTKDDFRHYKKKGISDLYVKREHAELYLNNLMSNIKSLHHVKNLSVETSFQFSSDALSTIHDIQSRLGFNEELEKLTQEGVSLASKAVISDENLKDLLSSIDFNSPDYIPAHSVSLAYLCNWIASKLGWTSEQTSYKLSLAAFMHDITLTHHELAKVRSLEELKEKKGQFPEPEANAYSSHPELSAAMVKSMSSAPMDVDIIVRQHHERPDGSGFPNRLRNEQLHPLSVVFITAHELLNYLYEHPKDWNFNDFLETNELLNAEGSTFFKLRFILKEASVDIHLPEAA